MLNQQSVSIKNGSNWEKVCPFPVGFIYLSQNSTSPASTYGGTWSALNEDRFLRPSAAWTTGGSKTIGISQMPKHNHQHNGGTWIAYLGTNSAETAWVDGTGTGWGFKGDGTWTDVSLTSVSAGGGQITGLNIEIATLGTERPNLYLLGGGER